MMSWYWIVLIVIAGCAVINPILYFLKWELYNRQEWIEDKYRWKSDERFFKEFRGEQIAEIRPQIKDVWNAMEEFWVWWFPVANVITTCYYLGCIIARPFEKSWRWIVRKIANIKV